MDTARIAFGATSSNLGHSRVIVAPTGDIRWPGGARRGFALGGGRFAGEDDISQMHRRGGRAHRRTSLDVLPPILGKDEVLFGPFDVVLAESGAFC